MFPELDNSLKVIIIIIISYNTFLETLIISHFNISGQRIAYFLILFIYSLNLVERQLFLFNYPLSPNISTK